MSGTGRGGDNGHGGDRKVVLVHRHAYELSIGDIPTGKQVSHRCFNPICCNPDHLFPATRKELYHHVKDGGRFPAGWQGGLKGQSHANSKLQDKDVFWIRAQHKAKAMTNREMADFLRVDISNVQLIVKGKAWKHLL